MVQKEKVQKQIREAVTKHEIELTKKIKEGERGGKMVWKNINKLRGKENTGVKVEQIYEEGKKMEEKEAGNAFFKCWKEIYNSSKNEIDEVWGEEKKHELVKKFEKEDKEKRNWTNEHMDMAMRIEEVASTMDLPKMKRESLEELLRNLKNNKAAGPDKLRGEIFKELGKSYICKKTMIRCYNNVAMEEEAPKSWTTSRTIMIKKTKRPTVRDFRPIALTNVSYKLYMSFIRNEMELHLRRNNLGRENQIGFTKGKSRVQSLHPAIPSGKSIHGEEGWK